VRQFDFETLTLDRALRKFVTAFKLPGEAQMIDRLMEAFARHFCTCNPGVFRNADAACARPPPAHAHANTRTHLNAPAGSARRIVLV
jgi:hypothetical protein